MSSISLAAFVFAECGMNVIVELAAPAAAADVAVN